MWKVAPIFEPSQGSPDPETPTGAREMTDLPPPPDRSPYAIELNPRQSRRLVERAARAGAQVAVLPQTSVNDRPLDTRIVGHTPNTLILTPDDPIVGEPALLVSAYCDATMWIDAARFLFATHIIDALEHGPGVQIEIARPARLNVVQRRRYQRRSLQSNSAVSIQPTDRAGEPSVQATLLNVSTGGLACRIDRESSELFSRERPVRLQFSIANSEETFQVPARVRGKVPAADERQMILSFEFVPGAEQERDRLSDALYCNLAALTGV